MIKHPDLSNKFRLLHSMRVNPVILSNSDLARKLNLSRQAVSRWCRGTTTQHGNSIPDYLIAKVAGLYDIDPYLFTLSFEEFEGSIKEILNAEKTGSRDKAQQISIATLPITSLETYGREDELKQLTESWNDPRINVVQVVGVGGVGKSALVNRWLSDLSVEQYQGANRVYAWSFYWQGNPSENQSSGDFFIEHALSWFGDPNPGEGTHWAKANRLVQLVRSFKTLLVLDGLEPIQYTSGKKSGEIESPAVSILLRELAAENSALCVLSSRLTVTDFQPYQDGRVESLPLKNLDTAASKSVLKKFGIEGEEREFEAAIARYHGHPLSLSLLGGYLSVAYNSDISKFREIPSLLQEKKLGNHAKNIMHAYLNWFHGTPAIELLYLIGLFDRAAELSSLKAIVAKEKIDQLTSQLGDLARDDWYYAIDMLKQAQLVSTSRTDESVLLDCHPIVRDFIGGYIKEKYPDGWRRIHELIFEHLLSIAVTEPKSMAEMETLFRAVIHGALAGKYVEAFNVYHGRIKNGQFSLPTEGSHHTDHACISVFFESKWTRPVEALSEESQAYLLVSAATNSIYLGHIKDALTLSNKSIRWFIANEQWLNAAAAAAPLASMFIVAGQLEEAMKLIEEMEDVVSRSRNSVVKAMADNFKAYTCYLNGRNSEAEENFVKSEKVLTVQEPPDPSPFPTISAYYCKYLLDTGHPQKALKRMLKTFAWRKRGTWQVKADTTSLLASDTLVLGLIFLKIGDMVNAKIHFDKEVNLFRSADDRLYLPTGLVSRARFYIETQDYNSAIIDLNESLELSIKTGARFGQWEAYIELATLHCKQNNFTESEEYLAKAKSLPGMGAYKFRDSEIEELEAQIQQNLK